MRIVVDLQGAQAASRNRGIGRYSLSLTLAIARLRGDHDVVLALNGLFPETIEPIRAAFDGVLPQDKIRVWDAPPSVSFISRQGQQRRLAAELLREAFLGSLEPDLCYITSLFEGFSDDAVTSIGRLAAGCPTAVTLYDLIPLIHRDRLMPDPRGRAWYDEKLGWLRRAALLLAISDSSRQEGLDLLSIGPHAIATAYAAADERFRPLELDDAARADLLRRHRLSESFVMYTGGDDIRKNMDGLVRAYARLPGELRQRHQLAIVCRLPDERRQQLEALAARHGLAPGEMVLTGQVSDDDLVQLYNACTLFVFPSWHEGFGLPALEAMCCGAPVIGSNSTSIPEVIGRADALFDPRSDESIAAKMAEGLASESFRAELGRHGLKQAQRFSWTESARATIAAFERVHAARQTPQRQPAAVSRRPKLAYVSPWPPDRSGIADYSAELLPALARHYDITLITSTARAKRAPSGTGPLLRDPDWLRANAAQFDRVLYQFGNSAFHGFMFDLLTEVPGVVVLHDFFLSGYLSDQERFEKAGPVWTRALYDSHGYAAVRARFLDVDPAAVAFRYPANLDVLRHAAGVIVHSRYARDLARQWYGGNLGADWAVVPHLRSPADADTRAAARAALQLADDEFVVCSFGHLGRLKLNDRLLAAWRESPLAADPNCRLVFVGECPDDRYGRAFLKTLANAGLGDRVRVTGWTEPAVYRRYLSAADVAVQLRTQSRGESSGAILDCLNHGLATIATRCGATAELPPDAVWLLPETFANAELATALTTLRHDAARRAALGACGRDLIRTAHDPEACAQAIAAAIERFHAGPANALPRLVEALAAQEIVPDRAASRRLAVAMARNHPALPSARRLFIDVSELVRRDAGSGVQRVTRNILSCLLAEAPAGFRVEPVYATARSDGFRFARGFASRLIGGPSGWADDDPADPQSGDVFLGLDLNQDVTVAQAPVLAGYRAAGVRVVHVIYDLLPVLRSDCFPADMPTAHADWLRTVAQFDGVVAISRAVAEEYRAWLDMNGPVRQRPLGVGWWRLGADIDAPPQASLPASAVKVLKQLHAAPSFLMVGTIEPRKGHAQALSAFERLWSEGLDVSLVIVGRPGWMVDGLVKRIRRHAEFGRRLLWLDGIDDRYLRAVYAASTCLLAPSEAEGFGLPLVEAAGHDLPILARDIEVFREVAGAHAAYFSGREPADLARAVHDWLGLFRDGRHPRSGPMPRLNWSESTRDLTDVVLGERWPVQWRSDRPGPEGAVTPG